MRASARMESGWGVLGVSQMFTSYVSLYGISICGTPYRLNPDIFWCLCESSVLEYFTSPN